MACAVDPDTFAKQRAPLFSGKRNFWIIAVDDSDLRDELEGADAETRIKLAQRRFEIFWGSTVMPILPRGSFSDLVAFDIADKPDATGIQKQRVMPIPVNPDWLYIGCEFTYTGAQTSIPWPWQTGFFDTCPEELKEGLWAVYTPAPKALPEPDAVDTLEHTADDIIEDVENLGKETGETIKKVADSLTLIAVLGAVITAAVLLRKK